MTTESKYNHKLTLIDFKVLLGPRPPSLQDSEQMNSVNFGLSFSRQTRSLIKDLILSMYDSVGGNTGRVRWRTLIKGL